MVCGVTNTIKRIDRASGRAEKGLDAERPVQAALRRRAQAVPREDLRNPSPTRVRARQDPDDRSGAAPMRLYPHHFVIRVGRGSQVVAE